MQTISRLDEGWAVRRRMVDDLLGELRERARSVGDPREVRLVETHISWVLVGPEAYKIKKPVTLPFLDFSSFEKRQAACRTEVRINRRLAPRTYLGVVPVRRDPRGHFTFGPSGPVVDWAVQMVRLDEGRRADVLLAQGMLTRELVDTIATGIARFHSHAESGPHIAEYGKVDVIERNVMDNFDALGDKASRFVSQKEAWEVQRWQLAFLRGHQDLFEQRIAAGAIRDGHGDLRLEHVFFGLDGDFEVIDGIEFDERYRYADVCADVAFIAMDLARLGRVDLAERFLATYARASNDFDHYRLVDFYSSYRAYVRAKIASIIENDESANADVRARAAADARRYLLLAVSAGQRSLVRPTFVAVAGGIASGKSTLADRLGEELSAPVIDADRTRKHMLHLAPTAHVDAAAWAGPYDPRFSERVYEEVLRRADAVLASGRPVIVDASFRTAAARGAARALASAHNVPFRLLECVAPPEVCRARLEQRDRETSVSDGRAEVFDAFRAGFEPITELPPTELVRIDTSRDIEAAMEQARQQVETWPRRLVG
ncbi:MAG TPA: AAA family ATPase [Labilithrix sp.]|nr:AAA family ATPase [Labilithrix sp.]